MGAEQLVFSPWWGPLPLFLVEGVDFAFCNTPQQFSISAFPYGVPSPGEAAGLCPELEFGEGQSGSVRGYLEIIPSELSGT